MEKPEILEPIIRSSLLREHSLSGGLDIHELIVKHPVSTFFVRAEGDAMKGMGISSGDILVVDRSLIPSSDKIVVCILKGEFLVRKLLYTEDGVFITWGRLKEKIQIESSDFEVWGVVTYVIHKCP